MCIGTPTVGTRYVCARCKGAREIAIWICPHAYIGPDVNEWVRARQWADRGVFPDPGGTLDQTAFLMEVFDLIDAQNAKLDS